MPKGKLNAGLAAFLKRKGKPVTGTMGKTPVKKVKKAVKKSVRPAVSMMMKNKMGMK